MYIAGRVKILFLKGENIIIPQRLSVRQSGHVRQCKGFFMMIKSHVNNNLIIEC